MPLAGARLKLNLAYALATLGERQAGPERLEEAVTKARESLQVIVHDDEDLLNADETIEWKTIQLTNLGHGLRCLGERGEDAEMLREAVDTLRSTIVLTTDKNAHCWAMAQHQLALASRSLGEHLNQPEQFSDSLSASDAALGILTRETFPFDWAIATAARANTLAEIARPTRDTAALLRAIDDLTAALAVFDAAGAPFQRRQCGDDLDRVRAQFEEATRNGAGGTAED